MQKDNIMLPYKLEQHLIEMCTDNSAYANLLSVWNINKKTCQDVLNTVIMNYPHYTKHDISHCEAIITNIEMLLGEDAVKTLSPTDTWLLLHAAYLHDIGMVLECRKIEESWETKEFQDYLLELEDSSDDTLAQNARFINSFGNVFGKKGNILSWPVKVRYAVTLIIADYYRRRHALESRSYIEDMGKTFHIDLGYNGLVQQRLISLLGELVCLHTEPNEKILDLDYQTNGYNADYAHPRFLAQMLRMGDLLDADNNRFSITNEIVFGEIPESSKNHWEKHMSARHILITPDIIEYRADCNKIEVYRETRVFLSWLKEEVEFWALNWKNIMPKNIKGSAPKLGTCELLLNGVPDIQGLSDLRFAISPEKAFEVIEGSNIYDNKFVFLREVIQNSLDACKIQLWRDISEKRYRMWIDQVKAEEIQPFDINQEIFNNYEIEVRVCNYDHEHFKVIIKDNGIGMSAEQLKKICDVGKSYSGDERRKDEIDNMPLWLKPTAGFGIGLQSIFLIAEEFEIFSKSSFEEGIYARVASRRRNGYVQITKSNELKYQGTEIHIILPRDMNFNFELAGNTYAYIEKNYDPFSPEKNLLYYKIWDELRANMKSTYFPVKLYFDSVLVDTIEPQYLEKLRNRSMDGRYQYELGADYSMKIWDNKTCTGFDFHLQKNYQQYNNQHFFKGMGLDRKSIFSIKGIWYDADFYGLDTKKTLALDRKKLKKEASDKIQKILDSAVQFYLEEIGKELFVEKENRTEEEYNQIYTYWCLAPLKKKIKLLNDYANIFSEIQVLIDVLENEADNGFVKKEINFREAMTEIENIATVQNLQNYIEHKPFKEEVKVNLIENMLNRNQVPFSKVIIDKNFSEVLESATYSQIMVVSENNCNLHLTSHTIQEKNLPKLIGDETKKILLNGLLKKSNSALHRGFVRGSMRRYIIGWEEYTAACTALVPFGIVGEWYHGTGYIISPITIAQWEQNKHMKEDDFVNLICTSKEFGELINHVYVHQVEENKFSEKEVESKYEELVREIYKNCIA